MKRKYLYLLTAVLFIVSACKKSGVSADSNNSGNNGTTVVNGKPLPSGAVDGTTFINGGASVIFNLYAPGKSSVSVIGEFNNWQPTVMNQTPDGTRWWVQIDNIDPSKEYAYQYLIDNSLKVGDPYCQKILDPNNDPYIPATVYPNLKAYPAGQSGIVSVMQANQPTYSWKVGNFTRPDPKKLVIYELHVRDFVATHSYKTLTDSLGYLAGLGVNAIELMPINEFEGNSSWGYNPDYYFAPDKYYGTKNDLKTFIDACHAKGIAVIQDMVLNHSFGSSPMVQMYFNTSTQKPTADNPWFNVDPKHPDNVGYDFNHGSAATKYFFKNVVKFWIQEYHVDGFRFDLAKGFTQTYTTDENAWSQYDASRISIWKDYNTYMKSIDPNVYVILEYFAVNQEEAELVSQGMMMWNNLSGPAEQCTMGYATNPSWDISGLFYDRYGFNSSTGNITYFESHDEERLQYKNEQYGNISGTYNVKDLATGLKRDEAAAVVLLSSPGPKMLWQFGEFGYDISINTNGRTGEKPIHWEYLQDINRRHLHDIYAHMIKWKINNAVFNTSTFNYSLTGPVKTVQLTDPSNNLEVVANFDVVTQSQNVNFASTGTWYDNLTGTSINVTSVPFTMSFAPGEYHVYSTKPLN